MGTKRSVKMKINASQKTMKSVSEGTKGGFLNREVVTPVIPAPPAQPEHDQYLARVNPTYVVKFLVLAKALNFYRKHDESPVPDVSGNELVKRGAGVTGLRGSVDLGVLEASVRWLGERAQQGGMQCPSCHKVTVLPMLPALAAEQTDGTTHVCHPFIGGCDMGFSIDGYKVQP